VGIEATPGTTTSVKAFIPFLSCDLVERHTPIADTSAKGVRDEQGSDSVEGKKWGEGSIEVVLDPSNSGYWFGLVLGAYSSSTSEIYTHEFYRKADNEPKTATIYRDRVVDEVKFPYSVANSLELNFADDVAKLTIGILSRYPIDEGSETPSYEDLDLFTFKNAYVEVGDAGSTTELKVREFNLSIENNAEAIYAPNDNDVDRIVSKQFGASGNIVIDFEDETQKDAFKDLTKRDLTVTLSNSSETGKIEINIPSFRIDNDAIDTPIDDISSESLDFVAEYDASTTGSITITIDNETVASYF